MLKSESNTSYTVVLFYSVSSVLVAEKILKEHGVPYKIIPVPRNISSDCGVCIRITQDHQQRVEELITGTLEIQTVSPLP